MKKRMYAANFLFRKAISSFSTTKQTGDTFFVPPPDPLQYLLINDVEHGALQSVISEKLNRKYLSVCEQSRDEILSTRKYRGIIYGHYRWFISVPTRLTSYEKEYRYVHYLVHRNSAFTTISQQALSLLHEKPENKRIYHHRQLIDIGPKQMNVFPSKTSRIKGLSLYNMNLLGYDYFKKFKKVTFEENLKEKTIEITLVQN